MGLEQKGERIAMGTMMVIEQARLRECEATIEKGMATFVEVGQALAEISEKKLYRDTHKTFEAYCKERWGHNRRWAYQLIDAAGVMENVRNCAQKPSNEAQARQLSKAPKEKQAKAWEKATSNGKPTAAKVAAAVAEVVEDEEEEIDEWAIEDASAEDRMADWNSEVDKFARAIMDLAKHSPIGGWWDDSQANIVKQQLKSAAGSARQAKCDNICPKCDGEGCKWCKQTGFMPKRSYEMAGGK